MNEINTLQWKQFKISELFLTEKIGNKLQVPTGANIKKTDLIDGLTPRITVTGLNNGVYGYYNCKCEDSNYRVFDNFISVSFLGTVFYHAEQASLDMKVHCLKPKNIELNKYTGEYLVTCIRKSLKDSRYSDQISSTMLPILDVKLPIDEYGNPDFSYMEAYMKNIEISVRALLFNLKLAKQIANTKEISTIKWKEFIIEDVFPKIIKPQVYHTREVEQCDDGIPYIVRSKYNNGVKYRVTRPHGKINPANVISFGAENATFFYQKEEWISGRDMYYIDTRELDESACLFLTACLQPIATKYSYNFGLFPDLLKKEKVKLPVNEFGKPNYVYMTKYMNMLKSKIESDVQLLNIV